MNDAVLIALLYVALTAVAVTVFAVNHHRGRKPRRDDLMAVHDAVTPTWHDTEIEALRALFHADQTPQPERRRT